MYGAADDLRCGKCAGRNRVSHSSLPRTREADNAPIWTFMIVLMAIIVYAGEQLPGAERVTFLWTEPNRIWDGEVWRLLTSVLPHINFLHLIFNCYWMAIFGISIERAIGSSRFLGLVLLTALGASAAEFLVSPSLAVGLSGVGYGLFGYLFAIRLYKDYARVVMTESVMKLFIGWFVLCVILTYAADWHIANYAHGGGFVVGWLVGKSILKRKTELRIAIVTAVVLLMAGLTTYMPWNSHFRDYRQHKESIQALRDGRPPNIDFIHVDKD